MQYILTEQEYKALTPINKVNELEENVRLLNDKVMELTEHPCGSNADYRSITFYCDDLPDREFWDKYVYKRTTIF